MYNCEIYCSFNKISKFEMVKSLSPDPCLSFSVQIIYLNFQKGKTECFLSR